MDWGRAKTILIVAFIITNVFLAYNLWSSKYYGHRSERISSVNIDEVIEILDKKGVHVNAPIPKDIYTNEMLTVEYSQINIGQLAETIYGERDVRPKATAETIRYSEDGIVLEVKDNREIFYNNLGLRDRPTVLLTEQEGMDIAEDFLREHSLYRSTMIIDSIAPTDKGFSIFFAQKYKDTLLEVSILSMEVTSEGVRSMRMLWPEPVKAEKERKRISHAIDALIKVAGQRELLDERPVEVRSIKLIHYFDWDAAKGGETLPVWRICTDSGTYYVNALSGKIIKTDLHRSPA